MASFKQTRLIGARPPIPLYFSVADMAVETKILKEMGISDSVFPTLLRQETTLPGRSTIAHGSCTLLGMKTGSLVPGNCIFAFIQSGLDQRFCLIHSLPETTCLAIFNQDFFIICSYIAREQGGLEPNTFYFYLNSLNGPYLGQQQLFKGKS